VHSTPEPVDFFYSFLGFVMRAHSRSQNGVVSLAYGGHPRLGYWPQMRSWMAGTRPAMTVIDQFEHIGF
jgi:hypothetical protein